jgi:hypothetical protein
MQELHIHIGSSLGTGDQMVRPAEVTAYQFVELNIPPLEEKCRRQIVKEQK